MGQSISVLDAQEYEAKGIKPCTIKFSRLADEYIQWWTGKDYDRARLVLWWEQRLGKSLLSDITVKKRAKLYMVQY